MLKKLSLSAALTLGLSATAALAAGGAGHVEDYDFSFEGPFGTFDQNQLQRGLKVYTEVCAACHGLKFVPIRTLGDAGGPDLPADQVREYAKLYEVYDEELEDFREAKPVDHFPESALENAPDLSLMAKARAGFHGPYGLGINQLMKGMGGPEYIASLMTGYVDPPACAPDDFDGYYNRAFTAGGIPAECKDENGYSKIEGSWIGMAPPLDDGYVEFDDGHENDLENLSKDVSAFLMWTAEPKMMARKQAGLTGVLFLTVLAVLLYLANKRLWAPIKQRAKDEE
ncbi:cytochrome c1 [Parasulfitobacter algicola]|uniref:Cytochrome c1 n=1 Tax=Parasulfitobacter algicola TaxID=2614809 RepID=A0ABX2IMM4_9RHOB|nr:cytochrome c1 [Sulfitobacter algicola]NSX54137.1 cytochrome c1 [Sulfitobacter algicola]